MKLAKLLNSLLAKYPTVRNIVISLVLIVLGGSGLWGFLGEFGTYLSAGMVLGGVLLLMKVLGVLDEIGDSIGEL